jgi:hypothetical protein
MRLAERHVIKRADPRFPIIDRTAVDSKNLYNNVMRKGAPDAFAQGSSGCVVHPIRLVV